MHTLVSEDTSKLNIAFNLLKESLGSASLLEFEIVSNSMFPFLKIGDKVTMVNITPNELKMGDIIVYKMRGSLCAHRYIYALKRKGRLIGLVTKADSHFDFDPYLVSTEQIIGKVVTVKKQDTKINLENFPWKRITYLIGLLSFAQVFTIKVLRYLKYAVIGKRALPFSKQIIAFPFSILIKSITVLAFQ